MMELIAICAPDIAPQTVQEIIRVESAGNPLAINVNKLSEKQPKAKTVEDAAQLSQFYIKQGYSVDMGLMQINSNNMRKLGISMDNLQALFNPCGNITAGATILMEAYHRASRQYGEGQGALKAALSAYNTGNFSKGFTNGYVAKFYVKTQKSQHVNTKVRFQETQTLQEALNAPTSVQWTPPKDYYEGL